MTKFSWLSTIAAARKAEPQELSQVLNEIRSYLQLYSLQGFEVALLSQFLDEIGNEGVDKWPVIRVAIIGSVTTQPLVNAIRVALFTEGYFSSIYEAPFATYQQEVLTPTSGMYAFNPEIILIYVTLTEVLPLLSPIITGLDTENILSEQENHWKMIWDELAENSKAKIFHHTFVTPEQNLSGIAERNEIWSAVNFASEINRRLISAAPDSIVWVDVDKLASDVGRKNWCDPRLDFHGKFPFALGHLPDYTALIGSTLRDVFGIKPKALIVDLDNTLWGGVIGDDGLEGIRLGPDSPECEAYQAFCNYVLSLSQRGVILGICSKNDIENVVEVFKEHPHMPLKLEDFAIIKCNWNDKSSNLSEISHELNIDISALVFIDDNPAECELIRQSLPSVRVLQMEGDPAYFVRLLDSARLFETQRLTDEDFARNESYQGRLKSFQLKHSAPDIASYLRSLKMVADIRYATLHDLPRLLQMEKKTNQFNLSTRRLGEEDIQLMINSKEFIVLVSFLEDRFSNHGLVSYMAAQQLGSKLIVTDWLMSCRVFSRTLEVLLFKILLDIGKAGVDIIELHYSESSKNKLMINIFEDMGFEKKSTQSGYIFVINTKNYAIPRTYISQNEVSIN